MSDRLLVEQAVAHFDRASVTLTEYRKRLKAGRYPDVLKTEWGQGLALLDQVDPVVVGPAPWFVAAPRAPITDITDAGGVGLLQIGLPGKHYTDYVSRGTFDSAVMLGPECGGTIYERFHLDKAASLGDGPGQGRHALYQKGPDVTCLDWWVRGDPLAKAIGSVVSSRYKNLTVRRMDAEYLWGFSLFDDDPKHEAGFFDVDQLRLVFASRAAIISQSIRAVDVHIGADSRMFGPNNLILTCSGNATKPLVRCSKQAQINGVNATAAMFENLPVSNLILY